MDNNGNIIELTKDDVKMFLIMISKVSAGCFVAVMMVNYLCERL